METSPDKKEKKWSIGTYLRIKPLKDDVAEQVNYNIQGSLIFFLLLSKILTMFR